MTKRNLDWEMACVSDILDLCHGYDLDMPFCKTIRTNLDRARTIAKMCSGFAEVSIRGKQINVLINKDGKEVDNWKLMIKPINF